MKAVQCAHQSCPKRIKSMDVFYVTPENEIVSGLLNIECSRAEALGIGEINTIEDIVDVSFDAEVAEALWGLYDDAFAQAKMELEEGLATSRKLGHQEDIEGFGSELKYIEDFEDYPGIEGLLEIGEESPAFESAIVDLFNAWAKEEFEGAGNHQYYHTAFRFFEEMGRPVTQELGVAIIEGRHPGDNTQVAELKTPISEANMRARKLGIDVNFEPHP